MKQTKFFQTLCLASFSLILISCDNSETLDDKPQSVKVLGVEASVNFDLSARNDWKFYVANGEYNLSRNYANQIEERKIVATPTNEAGTFAFSVTSTDKTGRAIITFLPEDYLRTRMALLSGDGDKAVYPNLENQSTSEKFILCDVLRGDYKAEYLSRKSDQSPNKRYSDLTIIS